MDNFSKKLMKTNYYHRNTAMRTNPLLLLSILIVSIFMLFTTITLAQDQLPVEGVWEGMYQLKFIWKIDRDVSGKLTATLNIPNQKTFNVPVENVIWKDDSLILEINLPNVTRIKFAGKYNHDSQLIEGRYIDNQNSLPMTLKASTQLLENMAPRIDEYGKKVLKYRYAQPPVTGDDWQTASLKDVAIDSTLIIQMLEKILDESYKNVQGILIVKDGKLVLDEYFYGYKRDQIHFIASVTKSVTGTCAGIAKDQNLITDLNTPLCSYFPEYSESICSGEKKNITLDHLLTMTAGFQWDEKSYSYLDNRNSSVIANSSGDCIRYLFERPLSNKPEEKFVYNSVLPNTMGEIIKKTSGLRLDKFAEKYLFAPLNIKDYYWEVLSDGRIQAGGGLSIKPRDMAKLALLYMSEGEYLGKRIVSCEWLQKSSARLTQCEGPEYWNHWGPNIYKINGCTIEVFSGAGLGGQWIFGVPELNLVVAITADFFGATEYGPAIMEHYILPAVITSDFVKQHPDFGVKIKELPGLKWEPKSLAFLGCIKGCLNYLHQPVSDTWLYGATGYAFLINIHEKVYSYSVGAWNKERLYDLGQNIGYETEHIQGDKAKGNFLEQQEQAWEAVRQAIDSGYPCYGYPLHSIPEVYLIHGYDKCGYYYNGVGCESGNGPKLWKDLGLPDQYFYVNIIRPCKPATVEETIKDALNFAVEFSSDQNKWIGSEYKAGPAAYDQWINALEQEKADAFGVAFNALVWAECRSYAAPFLAEAKTKFPPKLQKLFDEAIQHYQESAENLQKVSELFPFFPMSADKHESNLKDKDRCRQAIVHLKAAQAAEIAGLNSLRKILTRI